MSEGARNDFTPEQEAAIRASRPVFGLPCFGGQVSHETLHGMVNAAVLLTRIGINFTTRMIAGDSQVARARNSLVALMMEIPDATHLMFIDADIGFDPVDIIRLLGHDRDIVGGVYPMKHYPLIFPYNRLAESDEPPETDLVEVEEIATGFMLIKRSVIERMIEAYPEFRYAPDVEVGDRNIRPYALFANGIDNGQFVTEDLIFCRRWRAIGGKVHADLSIRLRHIGTHVFAGDPKKA